MDITFANVIVFTKNLPKLAAWYCSVFDQKPKGDIHKEKYVELEKNGSVVFAIADTYYMSYEYPQSIRNSVLAQISVSSIEELSDKLKKQGGKWRFGPSKEGEHFTYGGIEDPEGNLIWVFQK